MSGGWRLAVVVGEALANVGAAGARSAVLVAGLSGLFGALVFAELAFSGDVKAEIERFDAAGGRVAVVAGPDGLDASRCEALRWNSNVVAAGGWRNAGQIQISTSPDVTFGRWEVTGDVTRVWDPGSTSSSGTGYVVGLAAARELGLRSGSWLAPIDDDGGRVAVIDPTARNEFAARAILVPSSSTGRVAQCWVEFRPGAFEAGLAWLPAHFAADEAEVRPNVSRGEFGVDPAAMLAGRPQRWAWVPVGIVGAAMIALMALFRRSETAVYRAFGLGRTGLLIMQQVESIVVVAVALVVGSLWAAALHALFAGLPGPDQLWLALRTAGSAAALTAMLGPLGATVAGIGSPASLLKER